jgi:hypothetical protein
MNDLQNWRTEAKALLGPLAHHVREPSAMPTAPRALGLTVPRKLLAVADGVIE